MDFLYEITLVKNNEKHLYIQLYEIIKSLIVENKLEPHAKLPPIRKLSTSIKVNNVTVINAYKLLEQNNFVYKKIGSGTYVKEFLNTNKEFLDISDSEDVNKQFISNYEDVINFASTTPSSDLFPILDFKEVINTILDRDKGEAFGYQDSQGYFPLRESIKRYLKNNNINCDIENIQIVSGAQQGIDILSKTLIDYGDIVITESPTYLGAIAAFESRSAKIIEVPIYRNGIDIKTLQSKLDNFNPKFIYVMPNFQNPTGYNYTKEKKLKLLELANKYNTYIIEDDYMSDLSFNNNKNTTLKSMDTNNRVIYVKSFSKIFMPGLRLGFVVIPKSLIKETLSAKYTTDITTSSLIQRAFDLYLRKGIWDKHISLMEKVYYRRFKEMELCLKKYMPSNIKFYVPSGGLIFWISLPPGYSSNHLYKVCNDNNIVIMPGSKFYPNNNDNTHFRLSIASVNIKQIDMGVKKLSYIINEFLKDDKNKISIESLIRYH